MAKQESYDKIVSFILETSVKNDDGKHKEFSLDALKINVRNTGENDLLRPNRGAHPEKDDDGELELSKTSDKNRPSSVITPKYVDNMVTMVYAKASEVEVKATHSSLEEGKHGTTLETEGKKGQPINPSLSSGIAETLEGGVPETPNKARHQKLVCKEIVPSCKKKKTATISDLRLGSKLIVAYLLLFFDGVDGTFRGPMNQAVKFGDRVNVTCFTDSGYPIKWFLNQVIIYSGYAFEPSVKYWYTMADQYKGHFDLIIDQADEKMAGFYTCQQSGDVKKTTARVIMLNVICNILKTRETTVVCTAVISGGNVTRIHWEIIHGDRVTDASGSVILTNSDTVSGIQRQNITATLNLSENDLRTNGLSRLSLIFNNTEGSSFNLGPDEEMAENVPTYKVDIAFEANENVQVANDVDLRRVKMNQSTFFYACFLTILVIVVLVVIVVLLIGGTIVCGCRMERA